jgi:hypothetical protein
MTLEISENDILKEYIRTVVRDEPDFDSEVFISSLHADKYLTKCESPNINLTDLHKRTICGYTILDLYNGIQPRMYDYRDAPSKTFERYGINNGYRLCYGRSIISGAVLSNVGIPISYKNGNFYRAPNNCIKKDMLMSDDMIHLIGSGFGSDYYDKLFPSKIVYDIKYFIFAFSCKFDPKYSLHVLNKLDEFEEKGSTVACINDEHYIPTNMLEGTIFEAKIKYDNPVIDKYIHLNVDLDDFHVCDLDLLLYGKLTCIQCCTLRDYLGIR